MTSILYPHVYLEGRRKKGYNVYSDDVRARDQASSCPQTRGAERVTRRGGNYCVVLGGREEREGKREENEGGRDERKRRRLRKYQELIGGNMGRGWRPHFDLWRAF